jgi:hypothetical protein
MLATVDRDGDQLRHVAGSLTIALPLRARSPPAIATATKRKSGIGQC